MPEIQVYHAEVYAPSMLFDVNSILRLKYTKHALAAAAADRYGISNSDLPRILDLGDPDLSIIEVALLPHRQKKYTVRYPLPNNIDLVLVVVDDGWVRTLWGNRRNDTHDTLNRKKYVQPPTLH